MTQAERRAIAALERALRRSVPVIEREWLRVVRTMTAQMGEAAVARAVADGTWDAMLAETLATPEVSAALDGLGRATGDGAYVAADEAARGIGARYGAFVVDRLDPAIAGAVRTLSLIHI